MKVAILSMQEVKNYGSFLQAWSLKNTIISLGHTCDFINIIPGEQLGDYRQSRFDKLYKIVKRLFGNGNPYKRLKENLEFQNGFNKQYFPLLGVRPGYVNTEHYDVVVIGSDEVFNCAQSTWFGFSRQLFGDGINADKVITYAACFGATDVTVLSQLGIKDEVAQLLKKLDSISVRDKNSLITTQMLTGITPEKHVDPVLLYNYDHLMPSQIKHKKYMMVYSYPGRIKDKDEIDAICNYARQKGLSILSQNYYPWVDEVIVPSPFEMLAYFRDAECIVTDTFHGTIFSIKYNKPFCTIIRGMNNNKLSHLLEQFGLSNRKANDTAQLDTILNTPIDYSTINKRILEEKGRSVEYLIDNLK